MQLAGMTGRPDAAVLHRQDRLGGLWKPQISLPEDAARPVAVLLRSQLLPRTPEMPETGAAARSPSGAAYFRHWVEPLPFALRALAAHVS